MSLKINIWQNMYDLTQMMEEMATKDLVSAARAAMNSSVRRTRQLGSKEIRKRLNLKATEIKKRIVLIKARGGSLRALEASLIVSGAPISMLNFIVGSKQPIKQKGVAVKKRRKLKARVNPGKTIKLSGAFIQNIQSKHVFRHKGSGRRARKLSVKSLAKTIMERQLQKQLDLIFQKRFNREFDKQIRWRWEKSGQKFSKSPMRKLPR